MRKFIVGTLLFAGAGGGVVLSGAAMSFASGPTTQCNTNVGPNAGLGQTSVFAPSGLNTSGELQVCESGSPIVDGTVTAEGIAGPGGVSGYAVANGDPGSNATGYIGAEGNTSNQSADVVGCSQGDYDNGQAVGATPPNSNTDNTTTGGNAPSNNGSGTPQDSNGNSVIVGSDGQQLSTVPSGARCSLSNEPTPSAP